MVTYTVQVHIATDYEYNWRFNDLVFSQYNFIDPVAANGFYDEKINDRYLLAALTHKAVKFKLCRHDYYEEEMFRADIYDGENVRFWYGAYHLPGPSEIEERFYIDRIYYDIGYYAWVNASKKDIIHQAAAQSIEELQEILGDSFYNYELNMP